MTKPRINIIGSGKLGRTLVRLFADKGLLQPGDFFNRSPDHSLDAIKFCGAGQARDTIQDMSDADIWLIATPDDAIANMAHTLATDRDNWSNILVFHASGLHSSALLEPLQDKGALIASAHPAHSFAQPEQSINSYTGTTCTIEGNPLATKQLGTLFSHIGSTVIPIHAAGKALYHAATVMASNYLVTLQKTALDMLERAGIEQSQAIQILQPLMTKSLQNIETTGAVKALTGPIARGDIKTLEIHIEAISRQDPEHLALYKALGKTTVEIARAQNQLNEPHLSNLSTLFKK